ncbi:MAG: DUF2130 domain-containing protein [Candidatus Binataceae bacterium]
MSLSQSSVAKPNVTHTAISHIQVGGDACPLCDQPIPHDRFDEIKARIETRQTANEAAVTARLQDQFARQTAEALERERRVASAQLEASIANARREERESAELAAQQKLAAAEQAKADAIADMRARFEAAERARATAEEVRGALQVQLEQAQRDSEAAIQKIQQEADANALVIREEARGQAQAEVKDRLAALERSREESENAYQGRIKEAEEAKVAAEQSSGELRALLDQVRTDSHAAIEKATQDADARVSSARQDATLAAETALQERIAGAEQAKADAEAKARAAEEQNRLLQETHSVQMEARLKEQREAMENAQTDAVNAGKSAAFEKELKLSNKIEELQRALDNKTTEELGEGAEIQLYDVLKGHFEGDKIERINPGQPGADILHVVIHNGRECGSIIYDSKNHSAWRNDFVTKLAADQMASKADHAVLSTRKFPKGARHLHIQDGVILAAPSRVAALAQIIRQHIVSMHTSRLSDEARTQKTAQLYAFINSGRFRDIFKRIDTNADKLLDLHVKDKKAHDTMWKNQGELIRSMQKVHAEITNEIEMIIGTAEAQERAVHE